MKTANWKPGFKVVWKTDDGQLMSIIYSQRCGGVIYKPMEVTRPREGNGPLCVFSNLYHAAFYAEDLICEVYSCKYVPSKESHVWQCKLGCQMPLTFLPTGTALADAVLLGDRVPEDELSRTAV
jgi:hypothetical protein